MSPEQCAYRDASIPVVAFTAAFYDDMQNDLLIRGFSDHLHKPFKANDLYAKLSEYYTLR